MRRTLEHIMLLAVLVGLALTGVISYGQVQTFCTNISGNIACTSYNQAASSQTYCTSISNNLSCTTYDDDYSRVQIRRNYEIGQVIGTALGDTIMDAIQQYKEHKRIEKDRKDEWNQFVQDTLAKIELACELDPAKMGTNALGCRTEIFTFNQFIHRHRRDFVPDGKNVEMLADALDKTAPNDQSTWTAQTYEVAFRTLDKKQLDKKIYIDRGQGREAS